MKLLEQILVAVDLRSTKRQRAGDGLRVGQEVRFQSRALARAGAAAFVMFPLAATGSLGGSILAGCWG